MSAYPTLPSRQEINAMPTTRNIEFNAALGTRIRYARVAAKLSQGALGDQVGVTFQQVQKYESGRDRVSVEMLVKIGTAVGRPAAELLADEPGVVQLPAPAIRARLQATDALERLDPAVRRRFLALLEVMPPAKDEDAPEFASPAAEAA